MRQPEKREVARGTGPRTGSKLTVGSIRGHRAITRGYVDDGSLGDSKAKDEAGSALTGE